MAGVPYTFATASTTIPLSQLDSNFQTPITIGSTNMNLGQVVTTISGLTLTNVTISSGNVTVNSVSGNATIVGGTINNTSLYNVSIINVATTFPNNFLANSGITLGTTTANLGSTISTLGNLTLQNVTINSVSSTFPNNFLSNSSTTLGNTVLTLGGTTANLGNITIANVTIQSGNVTGAIPTTNIGNTAIIFGGTVSALGNLALNNVTINSVSTPIMPAQGGTGLNTLPSNNVLIGNGTGSLVTVAPGNNGNVLTSNGTSWVSVTPGATTGNVTYGNTTVSLGGTSPSIGNLTLYNANVATYTSPTSNYQSTLGFKNRIINGAMVIDQRNSGASVSTASGNNIYTVDRWATFYSQTSKYTIQQNAGSVTPPAGFSNYLGFTSSSSYSSISSDYFWFQQQIEGFNTADLAWGTANAKTVTISFWVYSSISGTWSGSLVNSAQNYSYPFSYTVLSANTWQQVSVTIAGPTAGIWIGATNGIGISVRFNLGCGSTYLGTAGSWSSNYYIGATGSNSLVGTNGATFYITGVQLEVGTNATNFEYRDYGRELILCQRYYQSFSNQIYAWQSNAGSTFRNLSTSFPVNMRASPTVILIGGIGGLTVSTTTINGFYANVNIGNTTSDAYITNYTSSAEL